MIELKILHLKRGEPAYIKIPEGCKVITSPNVVATKGTDWLVLIRVV